MVRPHGSRAAELTSQVFRASPPTRPLTWWTFIRATAFRDKNEQAVSEFRIDAASEPVIASRSVKVVVEPSKAAEPRGIRAPKHRKLLRFAQSGPNGQCTDTMPSGFGVGALAILRGRALVGAPCRSRPSAARGAGERAPCGGRAPALVGEGASLAEAGPVGARGRSSLPASFGPDISGRQRLL